MIQLRIVPDADDPDIPATILFFRADEWAALSARIQAKVALLVSKSEIPEF